MKVRVHVGAILAASVLALSACSSMESARHEYLMKGQVVELSGKEAVVCVGSRDGAEVGQQLVVYELAVDTTGGPARNPPRWQRVKVGTVRLVQVIDEHFARAEIVDGKAQVNNLVELQR